MKNNPEMIQMTKLANKHIKTVIITVLSLFKKPQERLDMLNRGMKDKKNKKQNHRSNS